MVDFPNSSKIDFPGRFCTFSLKFSYIPPKGDFLGLRPSLLGSGLAPRSPRDEKPRWRGYFLR